MPPPPPPTVAPTRVPTVHSLPPSLLLPLPVSLLYTHSLLLQALRARGAAADLSDPSGTTLESFLSGKSMSPARELSAARRHRALERKRRRREGFQVHGLDGVKQFTRELVHWCAAPQAGPARALLARVVAPVGVAGALYFSGRAAAWLITLLVDVLRELAPELLAVPPLPLSY